MPEFRRGGAAIQEATENRGGGDFKPFLPNIFWKNDKESHYILFLTPVEEFVTADMVHFIKTEGGYYESVIARTDPAIGESEDGFAKKWGAGIKTTTLGIAVELEPVMEKIGQRTKPTSFIVATKEFTRKVYDDKGEATDDEEEVTTPIVGLVSQSPNNFFNHVSEWDATESPVNETPLKITRSGEKKNVSYNVVGYDVPVDLGPLFEYLEGVTYLGDEIATIAGELPDEPFKAASVIGNALMNKRLDEFADEERYEELLDGVTESMDIYGKKGKKKEERKGASRITRASQRRTEAADEETAGEDTSGSSEETDAEEPSAPKAKAKAAKAKAAPTKGSSPQERLAALREKAAAKA